MEKKGLSTVQGFFSLSTGANFIFFCCNHAFNLASSTFCWLNSWCFISRIHNINSIFEVWLIMYRGSPTSTVSTSTISTSTNFIAIGIELVLVELLCKGQLISKTNLSSHGFFQKTNENMLHSSKNEFICSFFGRNHGLTICFRN